MDIANKRIVVTGGSEGIGFACALELLKKGSKVCLISRNPQKLAEARQKLFPYQCDAVAGDVSDWDSISSAIDSATALLGGIDCVVHCAGIGMKAPTTFAQTTLEEFSAITDTNTNGAFYTCRAVLPLLQQQNSGYIIMIASMSAHEAHAGYMAYCSSKFALRAMAQSLAQECKNTGVRVSTVSPARVSTSIWSHKVTPPTEADLLQMLRPEDVARTVSFLLEMPNDVYIDDVKMQPWHM